MMSNIFFKPKFLSSLLIILVSIYAFWGIRNIFFQQDEWLGLGGAIYRQETYGSLGSLVQIFNFHRESEIVRFLPVTSIANYLTYTNFRFNPGEYGLFALFIGIICALLINRIVHKLTNSYIVSSITSILWITNNLAYQAFTWVATMMPSLLTVLFFLLSLNSLILYIEKKRNYQLTLSVIFITLSLLAKESSIFYLISYFIVIWVLYSDKLNVFNKVKSSILFTIPLGVSLILPRLVSLFYKDTNFLPSKLSASQIESVYNFFLIPARSLFHVYFPQTQIYEWVYLSNSIHYSTQTNGFVVESIIADSLSLLVAFYFLMIIFIVVLIAKEQQRKIVFFSLISFFASTLPFVFFKNDAAILETRFYIFPALWASLLLTTTFYTLFSKFGKLKNILMILLFVPIILYYVSGIHKSLDKDILIGNYRKDILNTVSEIKPDLKKDNVFYFYTDNNGFYEFQSGFGQTLAVTFYDTGKIPKEVLTDKDYWEQSFEGLKIFNQGKFGYFMTYDKLVTALKDNKDIGLDSVHSFYWNQASHSVKDTSSEIRKKLSQDLTNTKTP